MDVSSRAGTRPERLPGGVRLRRMGPEDLPFVVREHLRHFPDGFFARLGQTFLTEYYRPYLSSRHARAHVADARGRPIGFLVGVTHPAAHRDHVLRTHGRTLLLEAARALLVRPGLALLFLRTRARRYVGKALGRWRRRGSSAARRPDRIAVLDRVAVTPPAQSQGVGAALIETFVGDASAAGCSRIQLVTADGEDGAAGYYESRGWRCCGEHSTPDGQRLVTYDRSLAEAPATAGAGS